MRLASTRVGKGLFAHLNAFQTIIVLAFAFAVSAILPQQSVEWYRYLAQSLARYYDFGQREGLTESIVLLVSLALLSLIFLLSLMFLRAAHLSSEQKADTPPASPFPLTWLAGIPPLTVGIGFLRATIDVSSVDLKKALFTGAKVSFAKDGIIGPPADALANAYVDSQLALNAWLYGGAVLLFLLAALFWLTARSLTARRPRWENPSIVWIVLGLSVPLVISGLFLAFPRLASLLSPIGILCLFFAATAVFLSFVSLLTARTGIPIFLLLVLASVAFGLVGLNDNHRLRELALARPSQTPSTVSQGFQRWLAARKDRDHYDTYPVYLVAAEGGGIYAAYRTATFLTSLQDQCPRFGHHLFAVSAVSGGSLGAAVYSALTKQVRTEDKRFEPGAGCAATAGSPKQLFLTDVAEEMLSEDYLSPVLAFFLFPDLVQRFLFFPVANFDRSSALEKSLEDAWDTHTAFYRQHVPEAWVAAGNPFREPFSALWDAASDVPALFLNTTEVETGRGRVLAPLTLDAAEFVASPSVAPDGTADIALSTATVLSARFPWLTPPGWFGPSRFALIKQSGSDTPRTVHLVDGAYFDNSGLITAVAIAREIQRSLAEMKSPPRVRISLLVLTSGGFAQPAYVVTDYLAPFQSILSTRAARASLTIKEEGTLFLEAAKAVPGGTGDFLGTAELRGYGYPLPLGWRLSPITRLLILGQNGDPSRCRSEGQAGPTNTSVDCLGAKIHDDMK